MMHPEQKFHICNIEPQGYPYGHFLDDACRLFCYAIESLGYTCSMGSNQLEPDRINVIFCGHLLTAPEHVASIAGACRYIAVQHEILNTSGVNLTRDQEHLNQVYLPFLRHAMAVWEGIPRNLEPLRQLGLRTAFFLGGYHPSLYDVHPKREQDIDFLFYGSITPYRREMLQRLSDRGHRVVAVFDPRATYRNDLIARAKVHLAPIQGPGMEHFAGGRVGYLLNNHGLVVVERCRDQEWLEHCFITAASEHWIDICEQTLQRRDRDEIRKEFALRFQQLPFTEQVRHLLQVTFATHNDSAPNPLASSPGVPMASAAGTNG